VQGVRFHKGHLLIRLEGIDAPEKVEALRGYWLLVPREHAHRLPAGAFYIYQVVGIPVYTEAGALVGTVEDVLVASANDVYVVKGAGVKGPGAELLVPAIKSIVKEIDVEGRRMVIADPAEWT
jgi:16S rRNA processing protein RimM